METPSTGGQFQQLVCVMQWMRCAVPRFSTLIQLLANFLETVYAEAGKRTKRAVYLIALSKLGWGKSEDISFSTYKNALAHQTTLAHRKKNFRLCVHTDACDLVCSGVVTQIPPSDISKSHFEQSHEPLPFLSGKFKGAQLTWSTLEKDAFAIMAKVERMHWILATSEGFDLFTNHHNLIFLFDSLAVLPDLSQTSLRKTLRRAVCLSAYNYTCVHIKGFDNV